MKSAHLSPVPPDSRSGEKRKACSMSLGIKDASGDQTLLQLMNFRGSTKPDRHQSIDQARLHRRMMMVLWQSVPHAAVDAGRFQEAAEHSPLRRGSRRGTSHPSFNNRGTVEWRYL